MNGNDFKSLTENRQNWVEANKANGFDEGITNLLTELYPDNAHFIYELLQNAEDANATEVKFELLDDELHYSHNGKDFTLEDVEGITSIGNGTKANDINKIGKFGVGFKAVFAYTTTPQIYSGQFAFEIDDLVVPNPISPMTNRDDTLMIFPFNHHTKDKQKAYHEIKVGLEKLQDNTLLFLSNIRRIDFTIDNIPYFIKRDENKEKITIINSRRGSMTHWLRFKKYLNESDKLYVSIAYRFDEEQQHLQPIDGQVSIFFPAEKEQSNLKFHIHAPFASTVARDSIKDLEENEELLKMIAQLADESLLNIRDRGLMNYRFMNVLPIDEDNLSDFYKPIQETYNTAFKKKSLLKTHNNSYQPAQVCMIAPPKTVQDLMNTNIFMEIINQVAGFAYNTNLYRRLSNLKKIYWLRPLNRKTHERARKFLLSLGVQEINSKIVSKLFNDLIEYGGDFSFLQENSDEWFMKLYIFLYRSYVRGDFYCQYEDRSRRIIKLIDGSMNESGDQCYFYDAPFSDYPIVHNKFKEDEEAYKFLEMLGTKEIEEKEKIEAELIEKYTKNFPDKETHLHDVRRWIEYFDNGGEIDFFQNYNCFLARNAQNELLWKQPAQIYIDEPVKKTGLRALIDLPDVYVIDSIYSKLDNNELKLLYHFLIQLEAKATLLIFEEKNRFYAENEYVQNNFQTLRRKVYRERESKKVDFADFYFQTGLVQKSKDDLNVSLLIWNRMRNIRPEQLIAKFKPNDKVGYVTTDSALIVELKEKYFIPDKDGNFHRPQDISQNMLPEEFVYDNRNGWLTAIGFGENVRKSQEEYKEKDRIAKEISGLSFDKLEKAKKAGVTDEDLERLIEEKEAKKLRESMSTNQGSGESAPFAQSLDDSAIITDDEKHQENIRKSNAKNTNKFTKASTSYQRQDQKPLKEIEDFLYKEYEGHCQICGDTFADKGRNVFKTKSLNVGKNRDVNRKGNSLSLCHKHHEIFNRDLHKYLFLETIQDKNLDILYIEEHFDKYDFVGKDDINTDRDAFYMLDDEDEFMRDEVYFFPIRLFGKDEYIKFTKAHIMEFIEVWNEN